jgi:hypothetical protein
MSVSTFKIAVILWYAEVVSLNPAQARCTQYNIYVIKIDSDLRQAGRWFSTATPVSSTNKTDRHDITEILLKGALNTITPNPIYDEKKNQ